MNFALVLAGGNGSRMGNTKTPKQFMMLGDKPIIAHSVERFFVEPDFEKVIVLTPAAWVSSTKDIMRKYLPDMTKIVVLEGGDTRNETLMNGIRYIEKEYSLDDDTIIVTHDAVRPFVTHRMIIENIEQAKLYGACDTCVPATDTIVASEDGKYISSIPERRKLYQGQTPQSFKAKRLKELYEQLTDEEKATLTDACKIFSIKGEKVAIVSGAQSNIKITYPYDLKVAGTLLGVEVEDD